MSVIPYAPVAIERWLLKMHRCRTRPDDIVLNRQDYLRYQQRRGALAERGAGGAEGFEIVGRGAMIFGG